MNTWMTFASHPAIENLGWALLHFVWQGAALALVLGFVLLLLRASSPNVRYTVCCIALALLALAPVVTCWRLCTAQSESATPSNAILPRAGAPTSLAPPQEGRPDTTLSQPSPLDNGKPEPVMPASLSSAAFRERLARFFGPVLPWLALGWLLGVTVLSLYLVGGWIQAERLKRRGVIAVCEGWLERLACLSERLGVRRPVRLLNSALVETPVLIGWFRPVVLLPMAAILGLTPEQVEAVLAHELAHVRRGDYLVRLAQSLIETLLFYHPAVWWVSRQINIEREYCCDDLAAEACGNKLGYARALTGLEMMRAPAPQLSLAAGGGSLLARVRRLLAGPSEHTRTEARWHGAIIAVAALFTLVASVYMTVPVANAATARAPQMAQATPAESAPAPQSAPAAPPAPTGVTAAKPVGVALLEFSRIGTAQNLCAAPRTRGGEVGQCAFCALGGTREARIGHERAPPRANGPR